MHTCGCLNEPSIRSIILAWPNPPRNTRRVGLLHGGSGQTRITTKITLQRLAASSLRSINREHQPPCIPVTPRAINITPTCLTQRPQRPCTRVTNLSSIARAAGSRGTIRTARARVRRPLRRGPCCRGRCWWHHPSWSHSHGWVVNHCIRQPLHPPNSWSMQDFLC